MEKARVLVVDDEPGSVEAFRVLLKVDYDVICVNSPYDGLDVLKKEDIGLVLLDLVMPQMDGITLLRKIRELGSDTAVVMISATKSIKTAVEAMRLGAFDYVTKPFEINKTRLVVRKALQNRSVMRELEYLRAEVRRGKEFNQDGLSLPEAVKRLERQMINSALDKNAWRLAQSANKLGITRRILKYKMDNLDISKKGA